MPKKEPCSYCSMPPDELMLPMGANRAHVDCVLTSLNELLDKLGQSVGFLNGIPKEVPRPDILESVTVKQTTGHGNLYVTITLLDGKPLEVFSALGKAGSCERSWMEAVTRAVSTGLRHKVPLVAYRDTLRGIRCGDSFADPKRGHFIHSLADGMAWVLSDFLEGKLSPISSLVEENGP